MILSAAFVPRVPRRGTKPLRSLVAGLIAGPMFLSSSAVAGQTVGRVVSGRVVDENQNSLVSVQVYIENLSIGALTDDAGRFRLDGIPAGKHRIFGALIGYRQRSALLDLTKTDSVELVLTLEQVAIHINGSNWPIPPPDGLAAALGLLPRVLSDSLFSASLQEIWPGYGPADTIPVWATWLGEREDMILGGEPPLWVRKECPECVERLGHTVEGGAAYTGKVRHVNVGLRPGDLESGSLAFCISFVEKGDFLLRNCGGLRDRTRIITYGKDTDGGWVVLARW